MSNPATAASVATPLVQDGPPLTLEMLVVFAIVVVAVALFVAQPIPLDVTALFVIVALVVLEPWTTISPEEGIAGFANPATITVLMMFILSEGVRRTGAVQLLGEKIAAVAGDSDRRQLASIVGVSGVSAGFVNNTPVVAIMIPVVTDLAERTGTSPSRLLLPLSFASMMGGMLTLIGTSTNLLASAIVAQPQYLGRQFTMFEFTALGALVLVAGTAYLLVASPYLVPDRIEPRTDLTDEFDVASYLTEVVVPEESPYVGRTVREALADVDVDLEAVTLVRANAAFGASIDEKTLRPEDVLIVRTDREAVIDMSDVEGLEFVPDASFSDEDLEVGADALERDEPGGRDADPGSSGRSADRDREDAGRATSSTAAANGAEGTSGPRGDEAEPAAPQLLVEVVVAPDGDLVGETLSSSSFPQRYDATVLAMRRGAETVHARMDRRRLRGGDTLLVQTTGDALDRLRANRNVIVAQEYTRPTYRRGKLLTAFAIVGGVVGLAALDVLPILVSSLAGAVAMVATGVLEPRELYDAVDWSVIVLLAGLIPLGLALEATNAAAFLAWRAIGPLSAVAPVIALGAFYLFTALLTNLLSNNASVVLMLPIAFDGAELLGASGYAFALAVTFAASTPFLTPVGYQTNLMVYGPGGYEFTDFARLGLPLQLLLTVVTTLGIVTLYL